MFVGWLLNVPATCEYISGQKKNDGTPSAILIVTSLNTPLPLLPPPTPPFPYTQHLLPTLPPSPSSCLVTLADKSPIKSVCPTNFIWSPALFLLGQHRSLPAGPSYQLGVTVVGDETAPLLAPVQIRSSSS